MPIYDKERSLRVGERDTLGFEFYGDDLPSGITVLSGTVTVSPATGLTLGSGTALITTEANGGYAWVTAAAAGEYLVTFTFRFSDGKDLVRVYSVVVPDPALSASNIVTIEEVKQHLGGPTNMSEQMIETAIETVSKRFASKLGVPSLRKTTYTSVTLDGPGKRYLYLPAWPVVSITSITEEGTALVEGTDYYVDYDLGILERISSLSSLLTESVESSEAGLWTSKRKSIVITYVAGYDISGTVTLPWDIKGAALNEAARMAIAIKNSMFGETSRTLEGDSVSFNTDEFLPDTVATLSRHRRIRL